MKFNWQMVSSFFTGKFELKKELDIPEKIYHPVLNCNVRPLYIDLEFYRKLYADYQNEEKNKES